MSLRAYLTDTRGGAIVPKIKLRVPRIRSAARELAQKFTEAETPLSSEEIEAVAQRLIAATDANALHELTKGDWRKAAWCLWLPEHELARRPAFINAYLKHIAEIDRRPAYKKLISAYLRDYRSGLPKVNEIGEFLASRVVKWDWVWAERQKKYGLFNKDAPREIAGWLIDGEASFGDIFDQVGLSGDLQERGLGAAVFNEVLLRSRKLGRSQLPSLLPRVLDWAADSDGLRYPDLVGELADAILLPWENHNPPESLRERIEDFILHNYKDPRIPSTPGSKWAAVSEGARSVMLRWLVGAALEQFLQVVDKVAMPSQWKYRRAFWTAYYEAGAIDEAWVAFAWDGQRVAKKSFGANRGFGKLDGYGVSRDHAVLIMKIGGLTIADWSHNGKCHIWTQSNKSAPKLYRREYTRDDLTKNSSNKGVIHSAAAHGTWQLKVVTYIRKNAGILVNRSAYMPKGK